MPAAARAPSAPAVKTDLGRPLRLARDNAPVDFDVFTGAMSTYGTLDPLTKSVTPGAYDYLDDLVKLVGRGELSSALQQLPRPVVRMTGSSTEQDLDGDVMYPSAIQDMTHVSPDLSLWRNHSYNLPDDLFGTLIGSPWTVASAGITDLWLQSDVAVIVPASVTTFLFIQQGRRIGTSGGFQVEEAEYIDRHSGKPIPEDRVSLEDVIDGAVSLGIKRVRAVEWSTVGIPSNQRSWVESAAKGYFARTLDVRAAPIVRSLISRSEYLRLIGRTSDEGLRKRLEDVPERRLPAALARAPRLYRAVTWIPDQGAESSSDAASESSGALDGEHGGGTFALDSGGGRLQPIGRAELAKALPDLIAAPVRLSPAVQKMRAGAAPTTPAAPEDTTVDRDADLDLITRSVGGKMTWPLAERDRAWDNGAAHNRILDWAGGVDDFSPSKMKSVHFYYDPDNADENVGAYKLLFVDIVDGKPMALPRAIFACTGSHGVDAADIPDADKAKIKKKIESWYGKMRRQFNDDTLYPSWQTPPSAASGASASQQQSAVDAATLAQKAAEDGAQVAVGADGSHSPFSGAHTHAHKAYGEDDADGSGMHAHRHTHANDAHHGHDHEAAGAPSPQAQAAGKSAAVPAGQQTAQQQGTYIKAAGGVEVADDGTHDAYTGTHTHTHAAYGAEDAGDDGMHGHAHVHKGEATHDHEHVKCASCGAIMHKALKTCGNCGKALVAAVETKDGGTAAVLTTKVSGDGDGATLYVDGVSADGDRTPAANVAIGDDGTHPPVNGQHTHGHTDGQGGDHDHPHVHKSEANHGHMHVTCASCGAVMHAGMATCAECGASLKGAKAIADDALTHKHTQKAGGQSGEPAGTPTDPNVPVADDGRHAPMTGRHTHKHAAYGMADGDDAGMHAHAHEHDADGDHGHDHASVMKAAPLSDAAITSAGLAAPASRPTFLDDAEAVALLGTYNWIGAKFGLPVIDTASGSVDLTKCDLVDNPLDAQRVISIASEIDLYSDGLARCSDAMLRVLGIPDMDGDGDGDDGYGADGADGQDGTLQPEPASDIAAPPPSIPYPIMATHGAGAGVGAGSDTSTSAGALAVKEMQKDVQHMLLRLIGIGDLRTKAGARNNKKDRAAIQAIHDAAAMLTDGDVCKTYAMQSTTQHQGDNTPAEGGAGTSEEDARDELDGTPPSGGMGANTHRALDSTTMTTSAPAGATQATQATQVTQVTQKALAAAELTAAALPDLLSSVQEIAVALGGVNLKALQGTATGLQLKLAHLSRAVGDYEHKADEILAAHHQLTNLPLPPATQLNRGVSTPDPDAEWDGGPAHYADLIPGGAPGAAGGAQAMTLTLAEALARTTIDQFDGVTYRHWPAGVMPAGGRPELSTFQKQITHLSVMVAYSEGEECLIPVLGEDLPAEALADSAGTNGHH